MPSCVLPTCRKCKDSKAKEDGITFHHFPTDEVRRLQWSSIIQKARILIPHWKPGEWSVICSKHFDETYFYITKGGLRRLKREAIPTKGIAMFVEEQEVRAEMEAVPNPSTSGMSCQQPARSPADSEIGDINMTDLDNVFDTPEKAILRKNLELKEKNCKRHMNIIKNLKRRNLRLIKQNETLKDILKFLKSNS